jgi:predicted nucleotidyltransferase
MNRDELVSAIRDLAMRTNANVGEANWYLFGSAQNGLPNASDIDLLVVCQTHGMADAIRQTVDVDQLRRPIHLSILTQAEQTEVSFVEKQGCVQVV